MKTITAKWIGLGPYLHSALRMMAAAMFILAGTTILFGFPMKSPAGPVVLASQIGIAGILETFGGALLLIGLFTRPVAFILSGMMAVAFFQFHFPKSIWPTVNGGVPAVLYCFIWLYLSAAGAGPLSLDALSRKK